MVKLPTNRTNTEARMINGVDRLMTYIASQITFMYNKDERSDNVVAIVKTGSEYSKCIRCGVREEWFPNDIIRLAIPLIIKQGYFVWYHCDYMGYYDYWITDTDNCPHTWFSKIY